MHTKVLLADDSEHFLRAAERFLCDLGPDISIAKARNGFEAVRLAVAERPDLALIDLNMPGMCGLEAVEHIKKLVPEVRIVVVSLHEHADFRSAAEEAGADAYITKRNFGEAISELFAAHDDSPRSAYGP